MFDYTPKRQDYRDGRRWIVWAFAMLTLIAVVGSFLTFGLRWLNAPLDVMSPARLQQLSREANDRWHALEGQRTTIGTAQARVAEFEVLYGADRASWPQGKREEYQQATTHLRNLITAYNLSCSQYNALWQDAWRDLPAPDDLPRRCEMY